jgi:hypothetical protein
VAHLILPKFRNAGVGRQIFGPQDSQHGVQRENAARFDDTDV